MKIRIMMRLEIFTFHIPYFSFVIVFQCFPVKEITYK